MTAQERNNHKRAWFWRKVKKLRAGSRLRFLDEAGANTILTRLYGRATPGKRVVEAVPRNYGVSTSMISLLDLAGASATMLLEGSVDTLAFDAYCQEVPRPELKAGDVIILDNLGAHRASRIEEIAGECGARVLWLPPYSPDFSPIEQMWSKVKSYLRKSKARTNQELDRAIVESLNLITASDCLGWFQHCGYKVAQN